VNTPGNKAAKKANRGRSHPVKPAWAGKRNAIAYEVPDIMAADVRPGAYQFVWMSGEDKVKDPPRGIIHACACGCGDVGALYFKGLNPRRGGLEWVVTGEWPKATLRPSIGFWGANTKEQGYHWHGYLTEEEFREI
jgi:hypothetical protein